MVEARLETPPLLSTTPTTTGPAYTSYFEQPREQIIDTFPYSTELHRNSSPLHDTSALATPLSSVTQSDSIFSSGDATLGMSEFPKHDSSKAGPSNHRRRPRPSQQRSNAQSTTQKPVNHAYATPGPGNPTENIHNSPQVAFHGSPIHYTSPAMNYGQRGGFVSQYTIPAQPNHMRIVHSPPYTFSHPYHHPMTSDNTSMMPHSQQNIHAMLQPHAPVFHYQGHSPETTSSPHMQALSGSRISPMYSSNPSSSPASPQHMSPATSQSGALSPSYFSPTQFQSLQYAPAITSPPYPYPPQSYPTTPPMYQPQYAPSHFPQHYPSTGEAEHQGAWYYLTHNPTHTPQQQYDANPQYQSHYTVPYPQAGVESGYGLITHGPSQQPFLSPSADIRTPSSESLSASGFGPPSRPDASLISGPQSVSSGSAGRQQYTSDRPVVRRSYHPNPPPHRSEWVMWAGNVPSDATHDELWRFFNAPPESDSVSETAATAAATGVLSIFLISRSSCAFINYETEAFLQQAIARFNSVPLRPNDPRCPKLVCRVRRKDDDLKAGVGGQRGMGMHTKWVKEQKGKGKEKEGVASDPSDVSVSDTSLSSRSVSEVAHAVSNLSMSSDEERIHRPPVKQHSNSSGSYASTNSSFLAKHFPHRFFILKSLTQEDLDISVERGLWATQKHNEEILDQAFRSSKEVHLVFSVNKSGEFYGYARMTGPVRRGEDRVVWASRPPSASSAPRQPATQPVSPGTNIPTPKPAVFFSPSDQRYVDESPLPINVNTTGDAQSEAMVPGGGKMRHSAPAMLGEKYKLPTVTTPASLRSLEQARRDIGVRTSRTAPRTGSDSSAFELDPDAPVRAIRAHGSSGSGSGSGSGGEGSSSGGVQERHTSAGKSAAAVPSLGSVQEVLEERDVQEQVDEIHTPDDSGPSSRPHPQGQEEGGEQPATTKTEVSWGDSFAVEWLCTDRVPFHRVKHLRNPWNRDREIKISRDGTELEPTVGRRLLDEWSKLADPPLPPSLGAGKPAMTKRDRERPTRS